jgi:putative hydrolase of the HAD superfamily
MNMAQRSLGLMNHDNIDPQEFLEFVHDIDISWLPKMKF